MLVNDNPYINMNHEQLKEEIAKYNWFHAFDFGDYSNWWGPNEAAVIAMLRTVGFEDIVTHGGDMITECMGRMVFHARKRVVL